MGSLICNLHLGHQRTGGVHNGCRGLWVRHQLDQFHIVGWVYLEGARHERGKLIKSLIHRMPSCHNMTHHNPFIRIFAMVTKSIHSSLMDDVQLLAWIDTATSKTLQFLCFSGRWLICFTFRLWSEMKIQCTKMYYGRCRY